MVECGNTVHGIGEHVVYRNGCVYRIADIRAENLCGDGEKMYYVMEPVFESKSVTYVPADSGDVSRLMRSVLSKEEIDDAIMGAEKGELEWPADAKIRAATFEKLITDGNAGGTLLIYKTLSEHKQRMESQKRKIYASDARVLDRAEKAVTEEFAFALGIEKNQVLSYIKSKVELV